jgi:DNA-binding IclR family transcriptional regulator
VGTSASSRSLDLLEAVASLPDASLAQCAERCQLPFSTAHRLLQTLVSRGYVVSLARGRYRVGSAALALTAGASLDELLREVSRPYLARLTRQCRTHAHLGIYQRDMVTYLVKQPFGRTRLFTEEGTQLEAYCSSLGKVLLAHLDEQALDRYLAEGALVALTPQTLVDEGELRRLLKKVKKRGWAADVGEAAPDIACIAVPVLDGGGRACAALSVSYGASRPDLDRLLACLPFLREASTAIHEKLFPSSATGQSVIRKRSVLPA